MASISAWHKHHDDGQDTKRGNDTAASKPSFLEALERLATAELDGEQGLARHDGDVTAYCQALCSFIQNTEPLLDATVNPQRETLGCYAIQAREIRNNCRAICATPLSILAEELEVAAKSLDMDFVWDYNGYLHFRVRFLIEDIEDLLDKLYF